MYKRQVLGANPTSVVKNADPALLRPFIEGAQALEAAGAKAIATSCGFLVMFQKEMAEAVNIPVISSSLLQVPFVDRLLGPDKKVGIITAKASSLTEKHFKGAGMENCKFAIQGMEEFPEFFRTYIENTPEMDVEKATGEMREAGRKLVPVSYTHLDVYKRQGHASRRPDLLRGLRPCGRHPGQEGRPGKDHDTEPAHVPVSVHRRLYLYVYLIFR